MNITESDVRTSVSSEIKIISAEENLIRFGSPFQLDDGDVLPITLKRSGEKWVFSDEGFIMSRVLYDVEESKISKGSRSKVLNTALSANSVSLVDNELRREIEDAGDIGIAFNALAQAALRIYDIRLMTSERIRSTFFEDLSEFLNESLGPDKIQHHWHDHIRDAAGNYQVDIRIKRAEKDPIFIFALSDDSKTRDATISIQQFKIWNIRSSNIGVTSGLQKIGSKVERRYRDASNGPIYEYNSDRERLVAEISQVA
jgi:hypothetical protein